METTSEETAVYAQYSTRTHFGGPSERSFLCGDCAPARKYLERGGGKSAQMQAVAVRIWKFCLTHCIALEVRWVSGKTLVSLGVDALSRQPWAAGENWNLKRKQWRKLQQLIKQKCWYGPDTGDKEADTVVRLGPASMDGGRVDMAMRKGTHAAVRPGRFLAAFTAKALVGGWRTVVIVPLWHGAPYATLRGSAEWHHILGRADQAFVSMDTGNPLLPRWLMCAFACDFSPAGRRLCAERRDAARMEETARATTRAD
jgi:hypothetical protein